MQHSYNTLDELPNKVCVPNESENLKLNVFNKIAGISESKTITKHIPCKFIYKFKCRKCNLNQMWNNNKCWCECKYPKEP